MPSHKKAKRGFVGGLTTLRISGNYGTSRKSSTTVNGTVRAHVHGGIDIAVPVGTYIKAPFDGTLTGKFNKAGHGLYVTLSGKYGGNDVEILCSHLSSSIVGKSGSKSVTEGEIIGKSGGRAGDPNAGNSRGAHIHFEYKVNRVRTHPKYFFSDNLILTSGGTLASEDKRVPLVGNAASVEKDEVEDLEVEVSEADMALDDAEEVSMFDEMYEPEEKEVNEAFVSGIWQITKLVMDSDVAEFMLYDTSVSTQTGPISGFFNKACQQPLVEFSGDTYGDQYYFLVRRPPFDYKGMLKTLAIEGITSEPTDMGNPFFIRNEDIISVNISQNTEGVYSWYQLYPVYEMGAQDAQYIIPAVLFPEYAAIWGSRDLVVRSQYRAFIDTGTSDSIANSKKNSSTDREVRHAIRDLKYLIECNAYNPFTRSGTIKIRGNRKIKRGTFVEVQIDLGLTEIYYVESVSQSYGVSMNSVERSTTLTVSRGMVKNCIFKDSAMTLNEIHQNNGEISQGNVASYFDLINFGEYEKDNKHLDFDNWREVMSSWKVNVNVFRFFMQKRQFIL